ncbi:MAG: tetratricopeptide repeat protein [Myxococcales bacterium]|nr:tetratricopeptide repeat protein [Myxococcales bacterium]
MNRTSFSVLLLAAVGSVSTLARANDPVAAQALFDEGKRLVAAGDYDKACPKLKESQRLDPAGGTLLHLANCYELAGKTASAWAAYNEALSWARKDKRKDREKAALARVGELEKKLSRVEVRVSSAARVDGLSVSRDGETLSPSQLGVAIPVDPGNHVIRAEAPGKQPWEQTIAVSKPGTSSVEVPALKDEAAEPAVAPAPTEAPESAPVQQPAAEPAPAPSSSADASADTSGMSGQKKIALVVGAVGVVGVGVGSYFGLRSMAKKSDADDHCDGSACRDQAGVDLRQDAIDAGNISTIAFAVGGVGVAAGIALWLTAPSSESAVRVHPAVASDFGGVGVSGRW